MRIGLLSRIATIARWLRLVGFGPLPGALEFLASILPGTGERIAALDIEALREKWLDMNTL